MRRERAVETVTPPLAFGRPGYDYSEERSEHSARGGAETGVAVGDREHPVERLGVWPRDCWPQAQPRRFEPRNVGPTSLPRDGQQPGHLGGSDESILHVAVSECSQA